MTHENVQDGTTTRDTDFVYDAAGRLVEADRGASGQEVIFKAYYDARTLRLATWEPSYVTLGTTPGAAHLTVFRYAGGTNIQEFSDDDADGMLDLLAEMVRAGGPGGRIGGVVYRD
jgi:hypothetical protein